MTKTQKRQVLSTLQKYYDKIQADQSTLRILAEANSPRLDKEEMIETFRDYF